LLALRADGALRADAAHRLERHLAECADCRALSDTLGASAGAVQRRPAPDLSQSSPKERYLQIGTLIGGRFAIERVESEGGMGVVYRAVDQKSDSPVAVKIMHGRSDEIDRFVQEARVLAELSHPSIVRYVAHGARPTGELYLAMEWLTGETLAQRLDR